MEAVIAAKAAERERRASPRQQALEEHGIRTARIRPGVDAAVLDVSAGGILVETLYRLLPGTTIELQLSTADGRLTIRGCVLRSAVVCVRPGFVLYRGAVAFERPLVVPGSLDGYAVPAGHTSDHHHRREDATRHAL